MTRLEFLNQLDYLLQDVDDKDRQDALDYYRDYMDEAGIAESDLIDGLLESPEKIAISLRTSLNGNFDEQIASGDQGFKNLHTEENAKVPEVYGQQSRYSKYDMEWESAQEYASEYDGISKNGEVKEQKSSLGKILLIAAICLVAAPVIFGIGGGLIGLVFGLFGLIVGLVFGVAGGAIGCLVGGVILFVMSLVQMAANVPQGIFMMGVALLLIAVGILLVMLTIVIFRRFIPWLIRSIVNIFRKIFNKNGGKRL